MPRRSEQRLSDRAIRAMPDPETHSKIIYDADLPGFGIRLTKSGSRSFVFNYVVNRRERRMTIGPFPAWSTTAARERVKALKREVSLGADPLADASDAVTATIEERNAPTISDLHERYCREHLPTKAPRSAEDDRRMWRDFILPAFASSKVADLTAQDVDGLHAKISQSHEVRANRVVALLRKALNLAIRWQWRSANPAMGVRRNREQPRERHLSQNEITRLTAVLRDHPQRTSADAILIMMLTGARRSEVLKATWDQFDLDTGIWIKPSAHTKQRRLHRVPISAAAVDLLRRRQVDSEGAFVFPGSDPSKPLTEVKRIWATVCREAGLSEWAPVQTRDGHIKQDEAGADIYAWRSTVRLHDLRHTYASILASQGLSLPIIGALLGHTQPQTTARYAHLLDDPLREATERAARAISSNGQGVNRTFDRAEPGSKA